MKITKREPIRPPWLYPEGTRVTDKRGHDWVVALVPTIAGWDGYRDIPGYPKKVWGEGTK